MGKISTSSIIIFYKIFVQGGGVSAGKYGKNGKKRITEADVKTPQFDPRFPNQNQTLNCFINYVDYYRCIDLLKGDEQDKCKIFKKVFSALCPNAWISRWDEMREIGNFPHPIVRVPEDCESLKQDT